MPLSMAWALSEMENIVSLLVSGGVVPEVPSLSLEARWGSRDLFLFSRREDAGCI